MTQALRVDSPGPTTPLEERLRRSLRQARGDVEIRSRLIRLARDPERFEALRAELGPAHALIRELRSLDPDADREPAQPSGEVRREGATARGGRSRPPRLVEPAPEP